MVKTGKMCIVQTGKMCIAQTGKMCIGQTATHPSMKEAALRAAFTHGGGFSHRPLVWIPSWMGVWLSAQCTSSLSAQCTSSLSAQCTSSLSAQFWDPKSLEARHIAKEKLASDGSKWKMCFFKKKKKRFDCENSMFLQDFYGKVKMR